MSTIVTRAGKGSALTWDEVDANFTNLNTDKVQSGNTVASLTITSITVNGGTIQGITDLAVADGGTGASTAAAARVNLLPSYSGNGSKVLALNSGATDVEWVVAGGGSMIYPSAGIAVSTGSAWGTSLTAPSGDIVGTTDSQTLTNKTISGSSNTLSNIGNSSLTNSSVTVNGTAISLGASGTITASTTNALTIGTGLSGTSFNGGSAVTIAIDSTVATLTGSQVLTNKTISVDDNTVSGVAASSFVLSNASGNIDGAAAQKAIPSGVVVGTTDSQTLTNKTLTNPTVTNYVETANPLTTSGGSATIDLANGTVVTATLTSATAFTVTMPTAAAGKSFIAYIKQPASGTATTIAFTSVVWAGGTTPTLTPTLGRMDIFSFFSDGSKWFGVTVGQNYTY